MHFLRIMTENSARVIMRKAIATLDEKVLSMTIQPNMMAVSTQLDHDMRRAATTANVVLLDTPRQIIKMYAMGSTQAAIGKELNLKQTECGAVLRAFQELLLIQYGIITAQWPELADVCKSMNAPEFRKRILLHPDSFQQMMRVYSGLPIQRKEKKHEPT